MRIEEVRDAAHRWSQLNTIRKKNVSVRAKMLEFLRANVGRPVTIEELKHLAGNVSEWARRVRELRTQNGWPLFSGMQRGTDVPTGSYVLVEDKQAMPHDRRISDDVRIQVLTRDDFACTYCGWTRADLDRADPRRLLELHHVHEHRHGGENTAENLVTLCNVDHNMVHAGALSWTEKGWRTRSEPQR